MYNNPFPEQDKDRHSMWEMLVERDIKAFLKQDWSMVANDFIEEGFMGIDARNASNPDTWKLTFDTLEAYKKEWLRQAVEFSRADWHDDPEKAFLEATTMRDIEISGDCALLHKKFDGKIRAKNGEETYLNWQTLYRCRKVQGVWKIAGFTGYMPHPMGGRTSGNPAKELPESASQHVTAGPYSPVLKINPGQLVVISGQASINPKGEIIGDTIEEQASFTIENCLSQLKTGGCTVKDVFKVNVYLTDLKNWPRFNEVYKKYFPEPRPVRTAVGTDLLEGLMVEIELWAVKK
ncbi:MAG: RidA family protein [Cyclobacteriaceae bacterium]|nr:RidA family protein [Cyclobacteriaceae bacterium]